jgi:hypothetical protein
MAWNMAEPPASERSQIGDGEQRGEETQAEHFGPVVLTRVRKDDGRALILYSHERERSA